MHQLASNPVLVLAALLCFYYLINNKKSVFTIIAWIIFVTILAILTYNFSIHLINGIKKPLVWDFTAFYTYGKVAAQGMNFYVPENFHTVLDTFNYPNSNDSDLRREVADVSFPYPPPTILYFLPLGYLSYNNAIVVWSIFNLLFMIGSIYLIYSMFLKQYHAIGLILVSILFLGFSPVISNIVLTQTNFLLLFLLLLMKKYEDSPWSGVFLVVAMFTKPYMAIFFLYFIFRKKWKALTYSLLSTIAIVSLTIIIVGYEPFLTYFSSPPTQRTPELVFSEDINQSLHAVLLRYHFIDLKHSVVYMLISLSFLGISIAGIFYCLKQKLYSYLWSILLLTGLIIYPGTLIPYGVILLFILFQFLEVEGEMSLSQIPNIVIISLSFGLVKVSLFGTFLFLIFVLILNKQVLQRKEQR